MNFIIGVLLTLIGYYVLKALWRLYKVVESDRPNRTNQVKPKRRFSDELGKDLKVEDARWRDLS
ncbi:MAG: hypothetical protein OXF08_00135 [Bacteroidetes bacterium]|nr:hypothetical protein [Bacteroidota bacterium]